MSSLPLRCVTPYFELIAHEDVVNVRRTARPFASLAEVEAAAARVVGVLTPGPRAARMLVDLREKTALADMGFEARLSEYRRTLVGLADRVAVITDLEQVRASLRDLPAAEAGAVRMFDDAPSALAWLGVASRTAA